MFSVHPNLVTGENNKRHLCFGPDLLPGMPRRLDKKNHCPCKSAPELRVT